MGRPKATTPWRDRVTEKNVLFLSKVLERVAAQGSISAGARELGLSTSAASRYIRELEEALGVRLMDRTTRQLRLTEPGTLYLNRATRILDDMSELYEAVWNLQGDVRGLIRVACSSLVGHTHVAGLIPQFLELYPHINVEINLTALAVPLVEEGYDVAIRIGPQADSALQCVKLGEAGSVVCATPEYLDRQRRPVHPSDLSGHSCILTNVARQLGAWRFEGPEGPVVAPVSGRLSTNNIEAIFQATLAGFGIANLPDMLVKPAVIDGRLERLLPGFVPEATPIYVLHPHRERVPAKVRAFIDFLLDAIPESLDERAVAR